MKTEDFVISSTQTPEEAIKHFSIESDSPESAKDFADQELSEFKDSLEVKPEAFN